MTSASTQQQFAGTRVERCFGTGFDLEGLLDALHALLTEVPQPERIPQNRLAFEASASEECVS